MNTSDCDEWLEVTRRLGPTNTQLFMRHVVDLRSD
jgi:hypothetical protein